MTDEVDVGDVYTNLELDLTYRVIEMRDENGEDVVTVETLDEGVETYRTVEEIREMVESGEVVESDVSPDEFDGSVDGVVPVESSDERRRYLRYAGAAVVALLLAGVLIPISRALLFIAARFLIPLGILVLGVYLLYRALS